MTAEHRKSLWRVYLRAAPPEAWTDGGTLPWHDPVFSRRVLAEHLDDSNAAASRTTAERARQIDWLWQRAQLRPGSRVLDVTCGPGLYAVALAQRGCEVTGIDISPAAIAYAREIAEDAGVADRCRFVLGDARQLAVAAGDFDAALLLYGQLAAFPSDQARAILERVCAALKPRARLVLELLRYASVDKTDSTWWFTDRSGLWGDRPFLHLGERLWNESLRLSTERYQIIDLESGGLRAIHLCERAYADDEIAGLLRSAGFADIVADDWDEIELYDAATWNVFLARAASERSP